MTIGKGTKQSNSPEWWTPDDLYVFWCKALNMSPEFDVAATKENRKCPFYYSKENDALTHDWVLTNVSTNTTRKTVLTRKVDIWCNPPGDKVQAFVDKAWEQWNKWDINILMLIPVNTITNKGFSQIWHEMLSKMRVEIYPLFGIRPKFLLEGKEQEWASRNGYIMLVFRKRDES